MFVHQLAKAARVALLEGQLDAQAELLDEVQIVEHGCVAQLGANFLVVQHHGRVARIAREEHEQVFFEIVQRAVADVERVDGDLAVLMKFEAGETAVRGDVLVLFADGLLQDFDLDFAGFFGDNSGIDVFPLERVHGAQQTDSEGSRGTEAGAGGDVGHADDFDRRGHFVQAQRFADERVPDFVDADGVLKGGIFQQVSAAEGFVDADVDVLVDRRGDDESAETAVIRRQIGTSASDRDAKWGAGDDHADTVRRLCNCPENGARPATYFRNMRVPVRPFRATKVIGGERTRL